MAKDILLDEDGDLLLEGGDLVIGESVDQEAREILMIEKGSFKNDLFLGSNLQSLVKSRGRKEAIKQAVRLALEYDGKAVKGIEFDSDGTFEIKEVIQKS